MQDNPKAVLMERQRLITASVSGDIDTIRVLLQEGVLVNCQTELVSHRQLK